MERRQFLKASLLFGGAYLGEQIAGPEALAAGPLKSARQIYTGIMEIPSSDSEWQMSLAVVRNRVIGGGYPPGAMNQLGAVVLLGTLSGSKFQASVYMFDDPTGRVARNTLLGKVTGRLKGAILTGKLSLAGLPTGEFFAHREKDDKAAMRAAAGVYEGEVALGLPNFKARATVGANGTFTLTNIRRPDGAAVPGRRGGVFLLRSPYPGSQRDILYAFPLPPSRLKSELHADAKDVMEQICSCKGTCCEDEDTTTAGRTLIQNNAIITPATDPSSPTVISANERNFNYQMWLLRQPRPK